MQVFAVKYLLQHWYDYLVNVPHNIPNNTTGVTWLKNCTHRYKLSLCHPSPLLTTFPLSHVTLDLLIPQPCLFLLYFSRFFFEHQTGLSVSLGLPACRGSFNQRVRKVCQNDHSLLCTHYLILLPCRGTGVGWMGCRGNAGVRCPRFKRGSL